MKILRIFNKIQQTKTTCICDTEHLMTCTEGSSYCLPQNAQYQSLCFEGKRITHAPPSETQRNKKNHEKVKNMIASWEDKLSVITQSVY
jgi:hypothetical protein